MAGGENEGAILARRDGRETGPLRGHGSTVTASRVLVTGGARDLGPLLCEHSLDAGRRVSVLDNPTYGQQSLSHLCEPPAFDFVFGDCRDERALAPLLREADAIIPLAAIVGAPACDR